MGVATIVHWGKFTHSHVAFWLWAGLYFTTPFLIFWVWWANRRRDVPAVESQDARQLPMSGGICQQAAVSRAC